MFACMRFAHQTCSCPGARLWKKASSKAGDTSGAISRIKVHLAHERTTRHAADTARDGVLEISTTNAIESEALQGDSSATATDDATRDEKASTTFNVVASSDSATTSALAAATSEGEFNVPALESAASETNAAQQVEAIAPTVDVVAQPESQYPFFLRACKLRFSDVGSARKYDGTVSGLKGLEIFGEVEEQLATCLTTPEQWAAYYGQTLVAGLPVIVTFRLSTLSHLMPPEC